jgi:hypothetical protein
MLHFSVMECWDNILPWDLSLFSLFTCHLCGETVTDGILSHILMEGRQNKNMTKIYVLIDRKEEGSLKISYYIIHVTRNQFYLPFVKLLSSLDYVDFLYSLIYVYMR